MKRREFLVPAVGLGMTAMAGCFFGPDDRPGDFDIRNYDDTRSYEVTVTVSKADLDPETGNVPREDEPGPRDDPLWVRDWQFEVEPDGSHDEPGLISEHGIFFTEAELDTGATASIWHSVRPGGPEGEGFQGESVSVVIRAADFVYLSASPPG